MNAEFMNTAISLAKKAASEGEVPVGAVIVKDGEILATGYNMREKQKNVFAHAESIAIRNACEALNDWRLDNCSLYVTLEPCVMCAGAIINSRISEIVFGAYDKDAGCIESVTELCKLNLGSQPKIYGGIKQTECENLLKDFFKDIRK